MREAVRHALPLLNAPVDLILHPRRVVLDMDFTQIEREVATLFRSVQTACDRAAAKPAGSAGENTRVDSKDLRSAKSDTRVSAKSPAPAALP
jgi:hypothetical protein